ncbi:MAG: DNA helicase, partial [Pseudomonadota bacterium]|nr:DNA helicase [Pseudomonadota bacterium]
AGKSGRAFTIAAGKDDIKYIGFIEKLIGKPIPPIDLGQMFSDAATSNLSIVSSEPRLGKPEQKRRAKPIVADKKPAAIARKNWNQDDELPSPPDCKGSTMRETGHIPAFLTR